MHRTILLALVACAAAENSTTACASSNSTFCSGSVNSISKFQVHKNPRPVDYLGARNAHLYGSSMSTSEWEDRLELAALGRCLRCFLQQCNLPKGLMSISISVALLSCCPRSLPPPHYLVPMPCT